MDILMIFIEMMVMVLLYNSFFNKGRLDKLWSYCVIVALCSVLFNIFNQSNGVFVYIVLLIALVIAIGYVDKKDNNLVLTEIFISVVLMFIIQSSIIAIVFLFTGKTKEYRLIHLILYVISILAIIILMRNCKRFKNIKFES